MMNFRKLAAAALGVDLKNSLYAFLFDSMHCLAIHGYCYESGALLLVRKHGTNILLKALTTAQIVIWVGEG